MDFCLALNLRICNNHNGYCPFVNESDASLREKTNKTNRLRNRLEYIYKGPFQVIMHGEPLG